MRAIRLGYCRTRHILVQHGGADPIAWIKKLSGRIYHIHLKDMAIVGRQQVMAEVERNLNWPGILAACKDWSQVVLCGTG